MLLTKTHVIQAVDGLLDEWLTHYTRMYTVRDASSGGNCLVYHLAPPAFRESQKKRYEHSIYTALRYSLPMNIHVSVVDGIIYISPI